MERTGTGSGNLKLDSHRDGVAQEWPAEDDLRHHPAPSMIPGRAWPCNRAFPIPGESPACHQPDTGSAGMHDPGTNSFYRSHSTQSGMKTERRIDSKGRHPATALRKKRHASRLIPLPKLQKPRPVLHSLFGTAPGHNGTQPGLALANTRFVLTGTQDTRSCHLHKSPGIAHRRDDGCGRPPGFGPELPPAGSTRSRKTGPGQICKSVETVTPPA